MLFGCSIPLLLSAYTGLDIGACPLTKASYKMVRRVQIKVHSSGLVCTVFIYTICLFKINITFHFLLENNLLSSQKLTILKCPSSLVRSFLNGFINRHNGLCFNDCYLKDALAESNTYGREIHCIVYGTAKCAKMAWFCRF